MMSGLQRSRISVFIFGVFGEMGGESRTVITLSGTSFKGIDCEGGGVSGIMMVCSAEFEVSWVLKEHSNGTSSGMLESSSIGGTCGGAVFRAFRAKGASKAEEAETVAVVSDGKIAGCWAIAVFQSKTGCCDYIPKLEMIISPCLRTYTGTEHVKVEIVVSYANIWNINGFFSNGDQGAGSHPVGVCL
jgi:hypothetical protein